MSKNTKSKSNTGIIILAVLLIVVIVCGIITHGFKDWTACGCFGHKYADGVCTRCGELKPAEEHEQASGNAIITNGESRGIMFASARLLSSQYEEYGVSAQAENAYTITATVDSEDEDFSRLNWNLQFVNPTSEWATDKTVTDYVTMTVANDTHSVTVSCLQAFGEQIKIVATAVYNSSATANCTVDYVKRVTAVNHSFYSGTPNYLKITTQADNYNRVIITPVFGGIGTVEPSLSDLQFTALDLNLDCGNPFTGNFEAQCLREFDYVCTTSQYVSLPVNNSVGGDNCFTFVITPDMLFNSTDRTSAGYKQAFNKAITFNSTNGRRFALRVTFNVVYNGYLIQSGKLQTGTMDVYADKATAYKLANSVSLSDTSIVL